MPDKPKVGFYWCASCGGCEESVVDLAESILDVVAKVDIVFWPVAMDFKREDVEALPDKAIAATMINGAIRTTEQEEMAYLLRRKSQFIIAYGACAVSGGIPALANQFSKEEMLKYVYEDGGCASNANPQKTRPQPRCTDEGHTLTLPVLRNTVRALDQVVDVDWYLPGCPPTPKWLAAAVDALLSGNLPPKGSVIGETGALCGDCTRNQTKPNDLKIEKLTRPHLTRVDPALCLLAQGIPCMGPVTRSGCGALCMNANMPCTGCFGPTGRIQDYGAKALSFMASSIAAKDEAEIDRVLKAGVPDPVGTYYRYGLAKSILRRKVNLKDTVEEPVHG